MKWKIGNVEIPNRFVLAPMAGVTDLAFRRLCKEQGAGLAAPQVGIVRRVVIVDVRDEHGVIELVNPEIIASSGSQTGEEGCLSDPGVFCKVTRPNVVTVKAQDRNGNEFTLTGEGLLARALCHETDHLDGVLFTDRTDD